MASECVRDQLGTPTEVVRPQPAPSSGVISKGTDLAYQAILSYLIKGNTGQNYTVRTRTINQTRATTHQK